MGVFRKIVITTQTGVFSMGKHCSCTVFVEFWTDKAIFDTALSSKEIDLSVLSPTCLKLMY